MSLSDPGSLQSFRLSFMSAAKSPFPSPLVPWHIAQSNPYNFFTRACEAAVGFTGFTCFAASGGTFQSAAAGSCAALPTPGIDTPDANNTKAEPSVNCFHMAIARFQARFAAMLLTCEP